MNSPISFDPAALAGLPLDCVRLRFFDVDVRIRTDSALFANLFRQMYRHFLTDGDPAGPPFQVVFLTAAASPWGSPALVLNGDVQLLNASPAPDGYIYESIFSAIIGRVRSHFLIHAGVVARDGQGVIISADSGHGKTTLVLELVRRGFDFLSDELAAISTAGSRVAPFPRSFRLRPGTLERVGLAHLRRDAPLWLGKYLLDVDTIRPGSLGGPAALRHVIFLHHPAADDPPPGAERELHVLLSHLPDGLAARVAQIEGVRRVTVDEDRGYPRLRLHAADRMAALARIESLCRAEGVFVVDVIKRQSAPADFSGPVAAQPIPASQAALELLRRFEPGHKSALLHADFGGNPTRLFLKLAEHLQSVRCWRMSVGPLPDMAGQVEQLLAAPDRA
ncbi:MAG: hypothetical protein D6768_14390 [Chloroflexi bacterium]|nr:MAG: hypothetical protein D6768_14390 [Chloroflexota bacterium]